MKSYPVYKVNMNSRANQLDLCCLSSKEHYFILGEAKGTGHFIVASLTSGKILPGIWHLDRFRLATEEEI